MIPEGFTIVSYCNDLIDRDVQFVIRALTKRAAEATATHDEVRFVNKWHGGGTQLLLIGKKK